MFFFFSEKDLFERQNCSFERHGSKGKVFFKEISWKKENNWEKEILHLFELWSNRLYGEVLWW